MESNEQAKSGHASAAKEAEVGGSGVSAGRGEGLAGLVAKWRERAKPIANLGESNQILAGWVNTCADELEVEIAALEAAAPASTPRVPDELVREIIADALIGSHGYGGSLSRARMDISNRIEKWLAALKYYASHADGGTGVAEAALATPSPQAPAATEIKRWFCQRCQREHSIAMPISGCEPEAAVHET